MMKVLRFHIGRGGRFYNQGHVTFIGFDNIQDSGVWDPYFPDESSSTGWRNEQGDELDCQVNEDGTGYVDDDGDYNSDYFVREDNLNTAQVEALIEWIDFDRAENRYSQDSDVLHILKAYYMDHLEVAEKYRTYLLDQLIEFTVPHWAMCPLINSDETGLTDEDQQKLDEFVASVVEDWGNAFFMLGDNQEPFFHWANDIDNLGNDCYTLYIRPTKNAEQ